MEGEGEAEAVPKKEEYREEQIPAEFGVAYDQPRTLEGYLDGEEYPQPHRYITNWYLTKNGKSAQGGASVVRTHEPTLTRHRRYPLPPSNAFSVDYVLRGELEPCAPATDGAGKEGAGAKEEQSSREEDGEGGGTGTTISVVLTGLQNWVIDRSTSGRGIWVSTSNGWYKLKRPSEEPVYLTATVRSSDGRPSGVEEEGGGAGGVGGGSEEEPTTTRKLRADLPSQSQLHLPLRAKFGLVSNLIDLLSERYNDVTHNYIPIHAKRSPESIHALLSPSVDTIREHSTPDEPLNPVPFDLDLLRECPGFVRQHLRYYHNLLGSDTKFMMGLVDMINANRAKAGKPPTTAADEMCDDNDGPDPDDPVWNDDAYARSATEAEQRGYRTEWGDPLPDWSEGRVRPNRPIDIEIQNAARAAAKAHAASVRGDTTADDGDSGAEKGSEDRPQQQEGDDADPEEVEDYGDDDDDDDDEGVGASSMPWRKKPRSTGGRKRIAEDDDDDDEAAASPKATPGADAAAPARPPKITKPDSKSSLSYDEALRGAHSPSRVAPTPDPKAGLDAAAGGDDSSDGAPPPLTLMTDPTASFSSSAMADALSRLSGYLSPTPTDEDRSFADYAKFAVPDDRGPAFLEDVVLSRSDVPSLEYMLLAVESLRRGGKRVLKSMFKASKAHPAVAGRVVFGTWLDFVVKVMGDRRRGRGGSRDEAAPVDGSKRTEEMVASSIMDLMCDFHVIKGSKQIGILKSKFGVDWVGIVDKTLDFATEMSIAGVVDSCRKAKAHLDSIMQGAPPAAPTKEGAGATNGHQTMQVKSETGIAAGDGKSSGAPALSSEDAEKLAKEKKEKEEKDRLRRQRMAQMLKAAQSRAGTAAYAAGDKTASKANAQQSVSSGTKEAEAKKPDEKRTSPSSARRPSNAAGGTEVKRQSGWGSQSSSRGAVTTKAESSGWGTSQAQDASSSGWGKASSVGAPGEWGAKPASDSRQGSGWGQRNAPPRAPADERDSGRTGPSQTAGEGGRPASASSQGASDMRNRMDQPPRQGEPSTDPRWGNQPQRPESRDGRRSWGNEPRMNEPPQDRGRRTYEDRGRQQDRGAGSYSESQQQHGRNNQYNTQHQMSYDGARGSFQGREGNAQQGDRPPAGPYAGMDQPGRQGGQMGRTTGAEDGEIGGVQHQGRGEKRERGDEAWDNSRFGGEAHHSHDRPGYPENSHQQRPGNDGMKRRRMDNTGGQGFAQDQPGGNRPGPPAPPTQMQQVGGPQGRGRGRGRGKDVNLPAWMTKNADALGDAGPPSAPTQGSSQTFPSGPDRGAPDQRAMQQGGPPRDQPFQKPPPPFGEQQGRFGGDGPGRGRGGGRNRGGGRGRGGGMGMNEPSPQPPSAGAGIGRGRGRGRGKDVNLPAWMTRQEG